MSRHHPPRFRLGALVTTALTLLLSPGTGQTAVPASVVDLLSPEETDAALEAIWKKTPEPAKRSPDSAKRAALQAYLQRLGPGTSLYAQPPVEPNETDFPPLKLHSELLPGKIGYLRLGRLQPALAERLESALRDFAQLGAHQLVLDLRATPAQGTLADAAALAECFVPEGTPLFSQRTSKGTDAPLQSSRTPATRLRVLLLTGPRTAGAVEAFAAVLRVRAGATVLGSPTRGEAADFEQIPLQNGRVLRLPTRLAVLPEQPDLFPNGLQPDVPCIVSREASDAALLRAAADGRVAPLLHETERPRLNEAALVAGKNPELDAWIQNQLQKKQPSAPQTPPVKDEALRLAVDFITALDTLNLNPTPLP